MRSWKRTVGLAVLVTASACASGQTVRLEKDVEELRESLAQAEREQKELKAQIEQLRRASEALRAELAQGGSISRSNQVLSGSQPESSLDFSGDSEPTEESTAEHIDTQPPPDESGVEEAELELPNASASTQYGALKPPEPGIPPGSSAFSPPGGNQGPAGSSQLPDDVSMLGSADDLYAEAFANFQKSSYHKAILQFNVFVERYPDHALTDNAFYWMGECWYGLRNYPRAISAYETVLERFPKGNKAPDALLKKAFSLQRSGKPREALAALHDLIQRYPRTPSAAKAQDKVKEIEESQS